MKKTLLITTLLMTSFLYSQDVKFKDGKVLIDKTETLSYSKTKHLFEWNYYKLDTTDDVMSISYEDNGTSYKGDDYTKLYFPQFKIKIESKGLWFGDNSRPVVEKLVQEKVLRKDGTIDEEKLKMFQDKHNEIIYK